MDISKKENPPTTSMKDEKIQFNKRTGTSGISGQLYEIYLVLLILLHGLSNKNITHFHLASNMKEAGDFDDVVFSYAFKKPCGAETSKIIFLQAKHKDKAKNIILEEFLGKTGKGAFDLKKYFTAYCEIKKNFGGQHPTHPIFVREFSECECELIIYTNACFKYGHTEKDNVVELYTEENWVLNFRGESMKYHQLRLSEKQDDRIKKYLGETDVREFQEFLSKLKICSAQPNQEELTEIIKEQIQNNYGVARSDVATVFPVVRTKVEKWWKDSSEYLTKQNTFFLNAAGVSIRFNVQDAVPVFTGRTQTLRDLHNALQSAGESVVTQSALVTGLGGIGKTELARKYVSQYGQDYDNNVVWINAETYATCSESFRRLAGDVLEIGITNKDGKEKDISSIVSEVYAFFVKRGRKSLFVFDNAENVNEGESFLPRGNNKPHVLITSRNQQWGRIKSIQLDLFTEEESVQFVTKYLSERRIELVKSLCEKLQHLPLALRQAVAYIERSKKWNERYTVGNYLKEFEDKTIELLGKGPQDGYTKTVLTTWQVTIEKIKKSEEYGLEALLILNIIAFFSPDNIPIVTIFESLMERDIVRNCVEILEQYSLVKLVEGEVSIHRLLQQVIRIMLKEERSEEVIIKRALNLFKRNLDPNCVIHARSVWDYAKDFNKLVQDFISFPIRIIGKLTDAINYNEACLFATRTHELFKKVFGENDRNTVSVSHEAGITILMQGKYNKAGLVFETVLRQRKDILGANHHDTLTTMHFLALTLEKQGKYKQALNLCQEVLRVQEITLKPDDLFTLATMNNLGLLHDKLGNYDQSIKLYQDVLQKGNNILGPNHPDTLTTMHNLALAYDNQGKYEQALNLYREVVQKGSSILGPDHPDNLSTINKVAGVLDKQGNYTESFKLLQKILPKRKAILGTDHPDTLTTMHNLATVLHHQGNYKKSLTLYQETLHTRMQTLGPNHPDTLTTLNSVALVLKKQGKHEKALTFYEKVLCTRKETLGQSHPETLTTMNDLATVLNSLGKREESLNLIQHVLNKREEILGTDHPYTLTTAQNLAAILSLNRNKNSLNNSTSSLNRNQNSLDNLTSSLNLNQKSLHERKIQTTMTNLAKQHEDPLILLEKVLHKRETILGPYHPDTLTSRNNLASLLNTQGKHEASLKLHEEVLCKRMEILGEDHPDTLTTVHDLGLVLDAQGKQEESVKRYQQVLPKLKKILGRDHPHTLNAMVNLGLVLDKLGKHEESLSVYLEML